MRGVLCIGLAQLACGPTLRVLVYATNQLAIHVGSCNPGELLLLTGKP